MTPSETTAFSRLSADNPVPRAIGSSSVRHEWRDRLLERIAADTPPSRRARSRARTRLVLVAVVALALLAVPSYGVARELIDRVRGEPAPQSVVDEFESYAPQLGYRPYPGGAILVAVEDDDVRLYSTKNDRGSYCLVLRAPDRPSGDGGTCIQPPWAAEPLIAGTLGATAGDDASSTHFIGGRSTHPDARSIRFADPDGRTVSRPIGFDGFFVASVRVPRSACGAGDWRPTFVVLDTNGNEVARAAITLLFSLPSQGVCGSVPPHPPTVK
jgi:hypothetical protein